MAKRRRGYMTVDVDLGEALEEIDDETLIQEVQDRKLNLGAYDFEPEAELREAYAELLRGRPAEALAILDRLLRPKWNTAKACEIALHSARLLPTPQESASD
jgi:hypothetical protein